MQTCLHHLIGDVPQSATADIVANQEEYKQLCTVNCKAMLEKIFLELEREKTDEGVLAVLRPIREAVFHLPRSLPLPENKPQTRWQRFAKEKGIVKQKRNRLVFDDVDQNWKLRWGGRSLKKAQEKRDIIHEHKPGENYMSDPFEQKAQAQSLAKKKQKLQQVHNKVEAAGYRLAAAGRHKPDADKGARKTLRAPTKAKKLSAVRQVGRTKLKKPSK